MIAANHRNAPPCLNGEQGREGNHNHRTTANVTRLEYALLAALVAYASAVERFRKLGAGSEIFADPHARAFARWVLAEWHKPARDTIPADVLRAAYSAEPGRPTLLAYLAPLVYTLHGCPDGDAWALRDVDHYTAMLARRWVPPFLRWWADRMEEGDDPHAEREVVRLVRLLEAHRQGVAA